MLTAAIATCAIITFGLRFVPLVVAGAHQHNPKLQELGALLPAGLMLILVAYTFIEAETSEQGIRLVIAAALALGVELVTRNILLAFLLGIITYSVTALLL